MTKMSSWASSEKLNYGPVANLFETGPSTLYIKINMLGFLDYES